ncbi:hypothetical protein BDA99DRAFT_539228 [Phascolomyces articulosus]|uniref:Uncharacterized protein n=1 Tax=Phascolomyces articulosus TaxID=60185 RepID=A0AAD5JX79_9FUNG|nr:hypothetical protein BDA99DRAFT_539228 [Phascolomyces articulosus]
MIVAFGKTTLKIVLGIQFDYVWIIFTRRNSKVHKLCILVCAVLIDALVTLWCYATNIHSLNFGAFALQFFVQGSFVHLNELLPLAVRDLMPGLPYQLVIHYICNQVSAASSQTQAKIGGSIPFKNDDGNLQLCDEKPIADYGRVQAIFTSCVITYLIIASIPIMNKNKDFLVKEIVTRAWYCWL